MTLADARRHADHALRLAEEVGAEIALAIVDRYGHIVQLDRMDGASLAAADLATAKARTALAFRAPTAGLVLPDAALDQILPFAPLAEGGGVPLVHEGVIVGALGVSGDDPAEDDRIARAVAG